MRDIPYKQEKVVDELRKTIKWIDEVCDAVSDVDHALGGLQIYFHRLEHIYDEEGGL